MAPPAAAGAQAELGTVAVPGGLGGGGGIAGNTNKPEKQQSGVFYAQPPVNKESDLSAGRAFQLKRKMAEDGKAPKSQLGQGKGFGSRDPGQLGQMDEELADLDGEMAGERLRQMQQVDKLVEQKKVLYRRLPATKEWIENNYYRIVPEQQTPELVPINRFWRDYANHQGGTFLSSYFAESNRTFTEMMLALAVLDLPEKAEKADFNYVDDSMTVKAAGPMIALHQQVKPAVIKPGNTSILISENYFLNNDRYRFEDGIQYDKFVEDERTTLPSTRSFGLISLLSDRVSLRGFPSGIWA